MPPPDDARLTAETVTVEVIDSMAQIEPDAWNALTGRAYPFLTHEFLLAAERSGCVSPQTGWRPKHLVIRQDDGDIRAAMPLYEKSHSWGEFVFDWAWANAYERAGLSYYPKLIAAVPFTPAQSPRLLRRDPADDAAGRALVSGAIGLARELGLSSLHVQFPLPGERDLLKDSGLKLRKDCQFHWHNRDYRDFEDFLTTFSAKKRKNARRDRRRVAEQGIRFRRLAGEEMSEATWTEVYELISLTFLKRGSMPYYDLSFFRQASAALPGRILAIVAERGDAMLAAAVFFRGDNTLYGRYWGSDGDYDALHFETCYYQGIEYCIEQGIRCFEPGTQGEHKISRGFEPVTTWSAHWLAEPAFFEAVGDALDRESEHVDEYMEAVRQHTPFRQQDDSCS